MTYIVGWKNKDRVFISGDMAVTTEGTNLSQPGHEISSFNERHVGLSTKLIQESLQKVLNLNSKLIFAYAGDVIKASDVAEDLKLRTFNRNWKTIDDFGEIINESILNCLAPNSESDIQFVIGVIINDEPVLWSYNARNDNKIFYHKESVQIGSLAKSPFYHPISAGISSVLIQGSLPNERMTACVNGLIQSYGVHDNLIEKFGVGGAIIGASISSGGITWQDNTIYVIYHEISDDLSLINLAIKDGVTILRDSIGNYRAFINSQNYEAPKYYDFTNKNNVNQLKQFINNDIYRYVIFLSKKYHKVVVLERNEFSPNSAFIQFEFKNEKDLDVKISPELTQHLMEEPSSKPNALPVQLTFLNDREDGSNPNSIQSIKGEFKSKI